MAAPLEMTPESAAPEAILEGVSGEAIEGRSLGRIAWIRLKRDKLAMAGGTVIVLLKHFFFCESHGSLSSCV